MKVYIVTNYSGGSNYTPSLFHTKEDAVRWMRDCTANNIFNMVGDELAAAGLERGQTDEILSHAEEMSYSDITITPNETYVGDWDNGNQMQLFVVDF